MTYARWLVVYASGLVEGSLMELVGFHHWSAWPGVIWLLLPQLTAATAYLTAKESRES